MVFNNKSIALKFDMEKQFKIEEGQDKGSLTFDLTTFFDENKESLQEFNEEEIQDNDLAVLVSSINSNRGVIAFEEEILDDAQNLADETVKYQNRFDEVTEDYLDELASETVKKKTKKQTVWVVKVFRSKFLNLQLSKHSLVKMKIIRKL